MIAIIGGTGIYDPHVFTGKTERIMTSYGAIDVMMGSLGGKKIAFLARHGAGHAVPPHKINYRANIIGLKGLGVKRIIAVNSVGCINDKFVPGDLVVPNDFIDLTKGRSSTFYDDEVVHIDFTGPYCPEVRAALLREADKVENKIFDGGVYACTQGPRFETPAEIRMLSTLGADIVGMTGLPEAILAREQEMCFASVCTVTNYAAGISKKKLTAVEVKEIVEEGLEDMKRIISRAVELIPADRRCGCGEALDGARM
ncbi:MAG: S-methyl-5'-thioadenosine phosphorylase [Candidatus Hydrothermarchaeaceae archaeon]